MRLRRGCERHVRQPEREIERAELRHAHGTMYITLGPCRPDVTLALRMKARWLGRHAVVVLEGRGLFVVFIVIGAARDAHLEVVGRSRAWILPPSGWRLCSSAPELAPRMPLSTLVSHRCPCGYELICDPLPARQSVGECLRSSVRRAEVQRLVGHHGAIPFCRENYPEKLNERTRLNGCNRVVCQLFPRVLLFT